MTTIANLPFDEYLAHPAAGNSDLKMVARSPAHYAASKRNPNKDTWYKENGRAMHTAILEPAEFMKRYIVLPPDAPRRPSITQINAKNPSIETVASIEYWKQFAENTGGATIIDTEKYDNYMRCSESVRRNPAIAPYLDAPGSAEDTVLAVDPETGLAVKCRPDWRCKVESFRVTVDLKSCDDARPESFARTAYNFGYFQQDAFYRDVQAWAGEQCDLFLFVAFERDDPYAVKVYEANEVDQQRGRDRYRRALNTLAECVANNSFPAYNDTIEVLSMPGWVKE